MEQRTTRNGLIGLAVAAALAVGTVTYYRSGLVAISDDQKLEVEGEVRAHLLAGELAGRLQRRPADAHAGVILGQCMQARRAFDACKALVVDVAAAWAAGRDADLDGLPVIVDDEILSVTAQVDRIGPDDWGGVFDLGVQYGQRRQAGASVPVAQLETGAWLVQWYGGENPWGSALPPPQTMAALTVEANRRWVAAGSDRYDMREVSSFALQSRMMRGEAESHVRPLLRQYRDLRFTQTRVILTLGGDYWDANTPIGYSLRSYPSDPGWWGQLDALVDMHEQEGLYTRLVLIGALEPFGGVWVRGTDIFHGDVRRRAEAFAEDVVRRYAGRPHVLFEIANEPSQISMNRSSQAIADLACRLKTLAPHNLLNSGDIGYMDTALMFRCADFADEHLPRDSGLDFLEAVKRMGEVVVRDQQPRAMPAMSGEPMNMGELRLDGRNADVATDPIAAYAYGAVMRVRQILPNFHYDGGLWSTSPQPETIASIEAFHAGLDAIPMLTDQRWRGTEGFAGDPLNYWDFRMNPPSDDVRAVEAHIRAGRGPFRVFGIGPWSVSIAEPPGWDATRWQRAAARRTDYRGNARYGVGIYARQ